MKTNLRFLLLLSLFLPQFMQAELTSGKSCGKNCEPEHGDLRSSSEWDSGWTWWDVDGEVGDRQFVAGWFQVYNSTEAQHEVAQYPTWYIIKSKETRETEGWLQYRVIKEVLEYELPEGVYDQVWDQYGRFGGGSWYGRCDQFIPAGTRTTMQRSAPGEAAVTAPQMSNENGGMTAPGCSSCAANGSGRPGQFQISIGLGGDSVEASKLIYAASLGAADLLQTSFLQLSRSSDSTTGSIASGAITVRDSQTDALVATVTITNTPQTGGGLQKITITVTPANTALHASTHELTRVAGGGFEGVRYTRTEDGKAESVEYYNAGTAITLPNDSSLYGTFKTVDEHGNQEIWTAPPEIVTPTGGQSATFTWVADSSPNGGHFTGTLVDQQQSIPASGPQVTTTRTYQKIGSQQRALKVLVSEQVQRTAGSTVVNETTLYGYDDNASLFNTAYPGEVYNNSNFGVRLWTASADGTWNLRVLEELPHPWFSGQIAYGDAFEFTPWQNGPATPEGFADPGNPAATQSFFAGLISAARSGSHVIAGCQRARVSDTSVQTGLSAAWKTRRIMSLCVAEGQIIDLGVEYDYGTGGYYDEVVYASSFGLDGYFERKSRAERWNMAETAGQWSASYATLHDTATLSVDQSGVARVTTRNQQQDGTASADSKQVLTLPFSEGYGYNRRPPSLETGEGHPLWSSSQLDAEGRTVAETTKFGESGTTIQTITTSYSGTNGSTRSAGGVSLGSQGDDVVANGQRTSTSTDAQGVTTTTVTDAATGEMIAETRLGVTTNYAKTTANNGSSTQTVTQSAGGASRTLSITVTDAQGRTVSSTDANGGETTYAYANQGRTVTETLPGGLTRVTQTYLDGQVQSITGTAGVAEYHEYTVNSGSSAYEAGSITETVYYGTNNGAHWRKVTTNFLGQVLREEEPSPAGASAVSVTTHEYNAKGQRIKTSRTGVADLRVEYDDWGRVAKQGYDVSGDNALTVTSTDVLSTSDTTYVSGQGTVLERVVQMQYTQDGSATGALQTTTERKLLEGAQWQRVTQADGTVLTQWDEMNGGARIEHAQQVNGAVTVTQTRTYQNGALVNETQPGMTQAITYQSNALGEITQVVHPLNGTTTRTYDAQGRLLTQSQSGAGTETYAYNARGQVASITHADNTTTTYTYDAQGRQLSQDGTAGYALSYEYDAMGRLWKLHTTRGGSDDVTTWEYVPGTNALASKTDAAGRSVSYTYNAAGRQQSRTWQRGVVTTYSYDGVGRLTSIDYSDSTPDVTHAYDRAGRRVSTTDAAGAHTFTYNAASGGQLASWSVGGSGVWSNLNVAHTYADGQRSSRATSLGGITLPTANYAYDATSGRMASVSADGVTASYRYNANTGWHEGVTYSGSSGLSSTRTADALGRLDAITWSVGGTTVSGHDYTLNAMHRRTAAQRQDGSKWNYGYNARGEVTSAAKEDANNIPEPGKQFAFTFDGLGNRTSSTVSSLNDDQIVRTTSYSANALNQYTQITHPSPGWLVLRGSANTQATVTIDGEPPTLRFGTLWHHEQSVNNSAGAVRRVAEIIATRPDGGLNNGPVTAKRKGAMFIPPPIEAPTYDLDGNQTSDARWNYAWDGENRMVVAEEKVIATVVASGASTPSVTTRHKLEFSYDEKNRRLTKKVWTLTTGDSSPTTGTWVLTQGLVFLYDQWNMLAEIDTTSSAQLLRSYEWGLDISGTLDGAGGVGGLLIERYHTTTSTTVNNSQPPPTGAHAPTYDGNGNITELVNLANGSISARYEYGAFGETIGVDGGAVAEANPFRFSTKYTDVETGLLDYLNRIYRPYDGRWQSKDPMFEITGGMPETEGGGPNLYGMVGNDPVNWFDEFGLKWRKAPTKDQPKDGYRMVWNRDSNKDTLEELAKEIKLDPSEAAKWAKLLGKKDGCAVSVPNIFIVSNLMGYDQLDDFFITTFGGNLGDLFTFSKDHKRLEPKTGSDLESTISKHAGDIWGFMVYAHGGDDPTVTMHATRRGATVTSTAKITSLLKGNGFKLSKIWAMHCFSGSHNWAGVWDTLSYRQAVYYFGVNTMGKDTGKDPRQKNKNPDKKR